MTRLPPLPELDWKDDGTPVSRTFDDVYFSLSDGLEETRSVFLSACGLPERWKTRSSFTVAELGFGTGLNFLALVACWLSSERPETSWLHFTSVEKFLMPEADARRALSRWPALNELAAALLKRWPVRTKGLQRIEFPEFRTTLTLYVGEAEDWLSKCHFLTDAWFLDGFAPAKNEHMWGTGLYQKIAVHSAPDCRIGTYTVAGRVRRGLSDAGFVVSKQPGFGRKRERLEAIWPSAAVISPAADISLASPDRTDIRQVVIVGAGIAGACAARVFAERGLPVTIVDQADGPATGASGNPLGLVMPRLDAADTAQARLLIHSYLRALRFYDDRATGSVSRVSVLQTAQNDREMQRFEKLLTDPPLDADWVSGEVSDAIRLVHHGAMIVRPAALIRALLDHAGITCLWKMKISSPDDLRNRFGAGTLIVLTAGWQVTDIPGAAGLPLSGRLGQVDWGNYRGEPEEAARTAGTYVLKSDGILLFGATFEPIRPSEHPDCSDAARTENLASAVSLAPDWMTQLDEVSVLSRASVRGTTPDRMPLAGVCSDPETVRPVLMPLATGSTVAGPLPHIPDLYTVCGLGARGFTFAPLLADLIAAQALGEPLPVARPEQEQVSPVRFLIRAIRRGG